MMTAKLFGGTHRREFLQWLGTGALAAAIPAQSGSKPLNGVFPIGQTPFTESNKLDLDCLTAEVKFVNRGGVHGFAWPQIASGWSNLSEGERLEGAEAVLAAGKGGRTALVIGVQEHEDVSRPYFFGCFGHERRNRCRDGGIG